MMTPAIRAKEKLPNASLPMISIAMRASRVVSEVTSVLASVRLTDRLITLSGGRLEWMKVSLIRS